MWRPLTDDELATRSEARLGGSLLLVTICASVLAIAGILLLGAVLFAVSQLLIGRSGGMVGSMFTGAGGVGALYVLPFIYIGIWAAVFVILTLVRSTSAPGFAAGGMAGWIGLRLVVSIAGQVLILQRYNGDPLTLIQLLLPILLGVVGDIILAAGFWGYMRDGVRPNAYYRRRVRG